MTPKPNLFRQQFAPFFEARKREQRREQIARSPYLTLANELASALGEDDNKLTQYALAFDLVQSAMWFSPLRAEDRAAYRDLVSAIARTNAPMPKVRAWLRNAQEVIGYA